MAANMQIEPKASDSKTDRSDLVTIWNSYVPLIGTAGEPSAAGVQPGPIGTVVVGGSWSAVAG